MKIGCAKRLYLKAISLLMVIVLLGGISIPAFATEDNEDPSSSETSSSSEASSNSEVSDSSKTEAIAVPDPGAERYYLDLADELADETKKEIVEKNKAFNGKAEIIVATVKSTGTATAEDFAGAMFTKWAIGGKDKRNGLLILLDIEGDTYFALTGLGLKNVFTVGVLDTLLETNFANAFTDKKYDVGVRKLFGECVKTLNASSFITGKSESGGSTTSDAKGNGILNAIGGFFKILLIIIVIIVVLGIAFVVIANIRNQKRRRKRRSARGRNPSSGTRSSTGKQSSSRDVSSHSTPRRK